MLNFLLIKEEALANIIELFNYWKLNYIQVNEDEYDFINPTRTDNNYGACRFNIRKGLGADFTGSSFTEHDFQQIGMGFSREDFSSVYDGKSISFGFDIIGLVQRLHSCASYKEAAELLNKQLTDLSKTTELRSVDLAAVVARQHEIDHNIEKKIKIARRTWDICSPIQGTLGETYLNSRMIFLDHNEPNLRFHSKIYHRETKLLHPAILLKCSTNIAGRLNAIHRIYLDPETGEKANLENPKLALGNIKGLGIWFTSTNLSSGTVTNTTTKSNQLNQQLDQNGLTENSKNICKRLCIVEGPENALSIRSLGFDFVVSTINASNFSNITIPEEVEELLLFPDGDQAGRRAAEKAENIYSKVISKIKIIYPPVHPDNPKWDWNDELQLRLRGKNVGRDTTRR